MIAIPLDAYLSILKSMSHDDHPFKDHPTHAEELGKASTAMAHAVAEFVEVGRVALGYDVVRSTLEDVVHTFPVSEHADPFEAIQAALLDAMGLTEEEAKKLLADD